MSEIKDLEEVAEWSGNWYFNYGGQFSPNRIDAVGAKMEDF